MSEASSRVTPALSLRQSIAPRVLDNSLPMATIVSTNHFSVRVAPPDAAPCSSATNILTTFLWRDPGASVMLAGSFDDWRKHQMMYVPEVNYHILVTELPPGDYFYRFVVDGRWRVAEADPNLKEDQFGQLSHFISINSQSVASATPKRFSTAAVAHAHIQSPNATSEDAVLDEGDSDTESETSSSDVEDAPLPPEESKIQSIRVSRKRGSAYVGDYDDDEYAGLDLQADVFEAMKDMAEVNEHPMPREPSPSRSQTTFQDTSKPRRRLRRRPGVRMLRKVWGMLFGESAPVDENTAPSQEQPTDRTSRPTNNQKTHGLVTRENAVKKGLKVWFPNERNFPSKAPNGRKVEPSEKSDVIDAGDRALKLHQVEENANNRQMLGKNLFSQGKYDAALALFSLSVKLREDNGLKYAKTTAIAHTDVASAFIHLEDLKNAEKHLLKALAIFNKGTFSGGKAQLGDVHCFLGVVGDMRGDLKAAEKAYRTALDLYEKCKSTHDNPNYATAIENLSANQRRQRLAGSQLVSTTIDTGKSSQIQQTAPEQHVPPTAQKAVPPRKKVTRPQKPPAQKPPAQTQPAPPTQVQQERQPLQANNLEHPQRNSRPNTWKGLADTARASMPEQPPDEEAVAAADENEEPPAGSYEEMCRVWHRDARSLLGQGKYKEAIDLYTLAVYTRKRHGPWATRLNVDTLVELARAQFATRNLEEAVSSLEDAISILEKLNREDEQVYLGEVWGNLGSVLDRASGRHDEALMAHSAGMVAYGKSGMSSDDAKWKKAWKGLCMHLKMTGRMEKADEIWHSIDLQIRGVVPMTKVSNVRIR